MAGRPSDPYRNFKFLVTILDDSNGTSFSRAGFSKISGLKHTVDVIDYREGGENETPRRVPGQSSFDAITLERGMSSDTDFCDWIETIYDVDGQAGAQGGESFRRTIRIDLRDKSGAVVKTWTVINAWPSEYTRGELDANGKDILITSLVVQNEGIKEDQE